MWHNITETSGTITPKYQAKYYKTPIGRLYHAKGTIQIAKEMKDKIFLEKGYLELDSITFLFPGSKEAKMADSIIRNKYLIYNEVEKKIETENRLLEFNLLRTRKEHETYLRIFFLDNGYDIKVRISGENHTNIVLTYALFNDVWYRKFETEGLFDKWAGLGFKSIILTDGYDYIKCKSYE